MDNDYQILTFFFWLVTATYIGVVLLHRVVEPIYIQFFQKPLYLYCYPILKSVSLQQAKIMTDNLPFYRRLTSKHKKYFDHRVADFIYSYEFYGKGGLEINDEIRTMIASSYVMLSFGMRQFKTDVFSKILVYPDSYHSTIKNEMHNGEFNPNLELIVFSWKHFKEGYQEGSDNLNLGIHEFAHALHYHGLRRRDRSAIIFADRFAKIKREVNHPPNAKRLIESDYFRIYAYTNEFEFLAVILEHFFETPRQFESEFPQLYNDVRLMINYQY